MHIKTPVRDPSWPGTNYPLTKIKDKFCPLFHNMASKHSSFIFPHATIHLCSEKVKSTQMESANGQAYTYRWGHVESPTTCLSPIQGPVCWGPLSVKKWFVQMYA